MKLIRNTDPNGEGKYALVRLDKIRNLELNSGWDISEIEGALATLCNAGVIEYGKTGESDEFFVLKLKDRFAFSALLDYRREVLIDAACFTINSSAQNSYLEYASEIEELARRSLNHKNRKSPINR